MRIIHGTVAHFSYTELEQATIKFSDANLIGVGGCSYVYRGLLKDGQTVAVKRLQTSKGLDSDSEFFKEVYAYLFSNLPNALSMISSLACLFRF